MTDRSQTAVEFFDVLVAAGVLRGATWAPWRTVLCALFGEAMSDDEVALYRQCTGRSDVPATPFHEAWLVCGRRSGKSFFMALVAVYLATFRDYRAHLGPGERVTIPLIARDRQQARTLRRFIGGLLKLKPFARMVKRETADQIDLRNGVSLEIFSASYRSVRGYTVAAALLDELAFWPTDDSANPDYGLLDAIRPAMATIPNAVLLCASSPHARRGALWDAHRRHYGQDGDPVLVWQAATRVMNETVSQRTIDEAMERDPAWAAAEYLAQFRSDLEAFVSREAVEACVENGVRERAPLSGISYHAFVDPSGGSSDSMTIAVAHKEGGAVVLDAVRERQPPFSPEAVVEDFATLCKSYRIMRVRGDRYAGEWPIERFRVHNITYEPSAKPKSDIYRDTLPLVNSAKVRLLDHGKLINQLCSLERRTARGGDN